MSYTPQAGEVNFEPSTAKQVGAVTPQSSFSLNECPVSGVAQQKAIAKTDDFGQAGDHWRSFSKDGQAYLIDLNQVTDHGIKLREVSYFYKADRDCGTQLAQATHLDVNEVAALAAKEMSH
ncbi:MAG: catalase family protein [Tardiphaga sp.]|nr:catalase family protein [Tardiphaga sp.]